MPTDVPTLRLETEVRGPAVFSVNDGSANLLQTGQNLAQHNMAVSFNAWEKQVKYASEIQGVRDASNPEYDPTTMPRGNTLAEEAYRDGASAIYGVRLESQTRQSLADIGSRNGNVAQAASAMDGYINSTAEKLPEQLRGPYLKSALQEKARIVQEKYAAAEKLRLQSIKDQTDLDRMMLLRDVQMGTRPIADALQSLQASYAAKVANGVDTPAGAYRDYLKDVDDFTVASSLGYYANGNLVSRMTELLNNKDLPVELKNEIADKAFQLGKARRQEADAAMDAYDKSRARDFNSRVNNQMIAMRYGNPAAPAAIDARARQLTEGGWNPQMARQQAIDEAAAQQSQQKSALRSLLLSNADRLTPNAAKAILDMNEEEANRPLTYDDPSVLFALNRVERENGYVPPELLNKYIGNGLSYESDARYRARSDERYQAVFSSSGWKEALRQVDIKFPEPTDSVSVGGIKISSIKWGEEGSADRQKIEQRQAIIGRLTDLAVANPALVTDPGRYKEWHDALQQTFATYGQSGVDKYTQDVKTQAEAVMGPWGGYDGFRAAYESGKIPESQFRDIYIKNGAVLREYDSLRKEGKIR